MDFRDNIASSGGPPLSVQEIAARAVDFEYNPTIPLRYWLRSADTILKEVCIRPPPSMSGGFERRGGGSIGFPGIHVVTVEEWLADC